MFNIRQYESADEEPVIQLSVAAWAPVFESMRAALGPAIYGRLYPNWATQQAEAVRSTLRDEDLTTWVATVDTRVAGFVCAAIQPEPLPEGGRFGGIDMLAVDPAHQRSGAGRALCETALDWFRSEGVSVAMVETGGDPGHAPARALYEQVGFGLMPISRYFQAL